MPTPSKPLSPAELSALEHAFASDPTSDAYRPLTEAYLAAGRFMEAMVVCKKGVKAHPDDPGAKVLLARIYADQGKDRKALEELGAVLAAYPTFAAAHRLAGVLHMRLGEREAGEAALRRAAETAPDDPETRELLARHGVSSAAPVPVAAAATRSGPSPSGPPVAPRVAPPGGAPRGAAPGIPARAPATAAPAPGIGVADEPSVDVPLPTPVPSSRARSVAYAEQLAEKYATQSFQLPGRKPGQKKKSATFKTTVALFVVLAAALGGVAVYSKARKQRADAIEKLVKEITPALERDAYPGYVEASEKAAKIVDLDPDALAGRAYRAYADAIRWAEHGDGDAVRDEAVRQVQAGQRLGGRSSYLVTAEVYLKLQSGDAAGAREVLQAITGGPDAPQSALLLAAQGVVELREGKLDAARDALGKAQKASPGDARIAWLLGEQYRRRGEGYELQASRWYDQALQLQKEHVPSILGKALVLLARGQAEEAGKAAAIVLDPRLGASRPQLALAHALRGGAVAAQGNAAEAAREEQEAAKLDPVNPEIPWLAGHRKLRGGDAAGAVEAFQRAVALDGKRVALYADLVHALLAKEGGTQQAIDTLKKAIVRLGDEPRLALLLGDAYRAAGDADLARGQYEKAIALGRPFPDARVALARLFRDKNNIPGALVELTQAIDEYGPSGTGGAAVAYVEKAEVEQARGTKREDVEQLYAKALELDPVNCDALWGAGKLELDAAKLSEKARDRLGRYVRDCPGHPRAAEARRLLGK